MLHHGFCVRLGGWAVGLVGLTGLLAACSDSDPAAEQGALAPASGREPGASNAERGVDSESTRADASEAAADGDDIVEPDFVGQSGSEYFPGGANRAPCPCGLPDRNLIRASVLGFGEGEVTLRVEELLPGAVGLEVGNELTARWSGQLPCWDGCASVSVGEQVLATYGFPYTCVAETPDDCPGENPRPAQVRLTPWGDGLVLGRTTEEYVLPVGDLGELYELSQSPEPEACYERFGDVGDLPRAFSDTGVPPQTCEPPSP